MVFRIRRSSSIYQQKQTSQIMFSVCVATIPGIVVQTKFFGWGTILQLLLGSISAVVAELLVVKLRNKDIIHTISDNSAMLTGILLAISVPPLSPWWIVVLGSTFSIVIAKQLYGGLGHNLFNPAMIGYVTLLISFPVQMTHWPLPHDVTTTTLSFIDVLQIVFSEKNYITGNDIFYLSTNIDGISGATPLDTFKTLMHAGENINHYMQNSINNRNFTSISWEWVNLSYLLGGGWLLQKKIIRWHIPVSFLITLSFFSWIGWKFSPQLFPELQFHLLSGATMLGAFFIFTDPVTSPVTNLGRIIFGTLAGILVWIIRNFGAYPDGIAFSELLMNITVPLIDYYTRPKSYGH